MEEVEQCSTNLRAATNFVDKHPNSTTLQASILILSVDCKSTLRLARKARSGPSEKEKQMVSKSFELYREMNHHYGMAETLLALVKTVASPKAMFAIQPMVQRQHVDAAVSTVEHLFETVRSLNAPAAQARSPKVAQLQRESDLFFGISTLRHSWGTVDKA